jgi:hypothetical protein
VKAIFFIILFAITFTKTNAQRKTISGLVRDSITLFPIKGAIITNGSTQASTETNERGFFRLDASVNDYIYALAKNYHYDTLTFSYLFNDTIAILLSPSGNILPGVIVRGRYNKYQLDSMDRKARFEQLNGKAMKTLSDVHPSGFGLTFNLDKVFKKQYRERNESEKSFTRAEKRAYIDYRFSPYLVNYYTALKGDELLSFMNRYTPSFEWLRLNPTNEDVLYYINQKLKDYRASRLK